MKAKVLFVMLAIFGVFIVTSTTNVYSQTEWTKHEANPLLDPGPIGAWDDERIIQPCVLFDGTTYHMWYSTVDWDIFFASIGYATSPDGISWTKYDDPTTTTSPFAESDPVFNPGESGAWDDEIVLGVSVLLLDDTYYMWYTGSGEPSLSGPFSIGRATSTDGINWVRDTANNPVLGPGEPGAWDDVWINRPCVIFDGTIYHMWYGAGGEGESQVKMGHATSPDGITWIRDANNPVLIPGSWDNDRIEMPNVVYDGSTFHMWYTGGTFQEWRIGYATSPDGSIWTKDSHNPVLDWGISGSWDESSVAGCSVVFDTVTYKMWYSGIDESGAVHIGYATCVPTGITGIDDNTSTDLPRRFVLSQNYPNPFNPSTIISYSIPTSGIITLKIYDILGREIQTLVSEIQKSGTYSINFDGSGLAGGIYFYRIELGDSKVLTQKMMLVK